MSSKLPFVARRFADDRRGATAVEFGLVGLVLIMLMLGTVDLARYMIVRQSLRSMAGEAARKALTISTASATQTGACVTPPTADALKAAVTASGNPAPMLSPASLTLAAGCAPSAGCPASTTGVRTICATATYTFSFVVPFLTVGPTLSAKAVLSY